MARALTLDILKGELPPLRCVAVVVDEFGDGTIAWMAELTAQERDERIEKPWREHCEETSDESNSGFRAFAVAGCWCHGEDRTFMAKGPAEIAEIAEVLVSRLSKPIARMFNVAASLNGLTQEELDGVKKNYHPSVNGNGTLHCTPATGVPESSSEG